MDNGTSTWACTTNSPMGTHESTLTLQIDGDTLTGTNATDAGSIDLENGRVEGNSLFWTMKITSPMPLTLKTEVTIDGVDLKGTIKAGAFPPSTIVGKRT